MIMIVFGFWYLTSYRFAVMACLNIYCCSSRICLLKTRAAGSVETVSPVQ